MGCRVFLVIVICSWTGIFAESDTCGTEKSSVSGITDANRYNMQYGDPQNCPQSDKLHYLESLPGTGWDNLRNVPMGPVLSLNYSNCRVSSDRKFLIPDDIYVEPIKESRVHIYSQLITHFSNYTSTTAQSINVEAHAHFHIFSASGSFSRDHQTAKQRIAGDKTTLSRSELRFRQYEVRTIPDAQLHPVFRDRVLDIVSSSQSNDTASSRYLAELLVRDYGTHIVTSVDAGALIVQEDHLNSTYTKTVDYDSTTIRASASASFAGLFGGSVSYMSSATHEQVTRYRQSIEDTYTTTYGGPPFRVNFTVNSWVDGMDNNLVTVDRRGDPLYYAITPGSLPDVPLDSIRDVSGFIKEAVINYYRHNIYRGCTSIDSPNFSYIANLDDGTCKDPSNNYTLGGVYQKCAGGLCDSKYSQVNPRTQKYSCPPQYNPIPIFRGYKQQCHRECKHFLWIKYHCHDVCVDANYEAYWCAASGTVKADSGYLFGGVYSASTTNPLTNGKSCPDHFIPMRIGTDLAMFICISDDYELGYRYSVPFAGFFSCQAGNPLALRNDLNQLKAESTGDGSLSLGAFLYKEGQSSWPKTCPQGYSQHILAITEGCEINYCVRAHTLTAMSLPVIKRPPFAVEPPLLQNSTRLFVGSTNKIWMKLGGQRRWQESELLTSQQNAATVKAIIQGVSLSPADKSAQTDGGSGASSNSTFTSTTTIVLSVLGTLVIAASLALGIWVVLKKKERTGGNGAGEREALLGQQNLGSSYPPIGDDHDARV